MVGLILADYEIARRIVPLVAVYVMDLMTTIKKMPKSRLCNTEMLKN